MENSILALPLRFLRSLDHLIRPLEHADRNCQTDLLRCLQVDDKLKLRRLLHRQVSRFGTFQDLVHVNSRAPMEVNNALSSPLTASVLLPRSDQLLNEPSPPQAPADAHSFARQIGTGW
jgi:hypothetical protein